MNTLKKIRKKRRKFFLPLSYSSSVLVNAPSRGPWTDAGVAQGAGEKSGRVGVGQDHAHLENHTLQWEEEDDGLIDP